MQQAASPRRHPLYTAKQRRLAGDVVKQEVPTQRNRIDLTSKIRKTSDRLQLAREYDVARRRRPNIERLLTQAIPREVERAFQAIGNCEREHAHQLGGGPDPIVPIGLQNDLGVGLGLKLGSACFELRPQLDVI